MLCGGKPGELELSDNGNRTHEVSKLYEEVDVAVMFICRAEFNKLMSKLSSNTTP